MRGFILLLLLLSALGSWASEISFGKSIRPLLKAHCFHCHGEGGRKEGGVDLRLRRFLLKETDAGPVMVPGDPGRSHLLALVRSGEMPKGETKLSAAEIGLLESWIAAGAPVQTPEPESIPDIYIPDEERNFWSFRPVQASAVPVGAGHPVDLFVGAQLRAAGLDFLPEADAPTLFRRLSFDLTGLPPEPEALEAFLAAWERDPESAWQEAIGAALSSPHYGERWGRHWLDAAGYADSDGHEADKPRAHAWHYRDYVVAALRDDLPWDRFLMEQLAGDELAAVTHDTAAASVHREGVAAQLAATGFLRMAPDPTDEGLPDPALARNQVMAETIRVVTSSLLGLTVACAQCHDHRYDPISHVDYHRMRAVFEPLYDWKEWRPPGQRLYSLYTAAERAEAARIEAEAAEMDAERTSFALRRLDQIFAERLAQVPEAEREAVRVARNTGEAKRTPAQQELLKRYVEANVARQEGLLLLFDPAAEATRKEMEAKAATHRATRPRERFLMAATETGSRPVTVLFHRGDHLQPRGPIDPAPPEVLAAEPVNPFGGTIPELPSSGRRLAFARWITSGDNPLTARVLVNRFWMHHFGRGIVRTPGDFGALGERPTHPELLDWLASDFVRHGWQLKRMHRLILTSRTWRQRSDPNPPDGTGEQLYHGWKLQRLDAESVRDAMLAVSGQIDRRVGGEPVPVARDVGSGRIVPGREVINPGNGMIDRIDSVAAQGNRRSLYMEARRSRPLTVLEAFDLPVMNPNCTARSVTTVAPQALLLLNDAFVAEQAATFAARIRKATEAPVEQIRCAWKLAFSREPSALETSRSLVFLHRQREALRQSGQASESAGSRALTAWCHVLLAANRFLYLD
jgi:mono/diheme cytochrome c family protein